MEMSCPLMVITQKLYPFHISHLLLIVEWNLPHLNFDFSTLIPSKTSKKYCEIWDRNEACPTRLPMKCGHRSKLKVVQALASNMQSNLYSALAASCLLSKPRSNELSKCWWGKKLSKLKTACRTALCRAKRLPVDHSQCLEHWNIYRDKHREFIKVIIDTKAVYWPNFCTDTNSLSATAKLHKLLCKDETNKLTWLKETQSPVKNFFNTAWRKLCTHKNPEFLKW